MCDLVPSVVGIEERGVEATSQLGGKAHVVDLLLRETGFGFGERKEIRVGLGVLSGDVIRLSRFHRAEAQN
jgi:hypothetical protein